MDNFPLSPGQASLWSLAHLSSPSRVFSIALLLPIRSFLNRDLLQQIFLALVHLGSSLRSWYHLLRSGPIRQVHSLIGIDIQPTETLELSDSQSTM